MAELKLYDYTKFKKDNDEHKPLREFQLYEPYSVIVDSTNGGNDKTPVIQEIWVECDGDMYNNSYIVEYNRNWFTVIKDRNLIRIVIDKFYGTDVRSDSVTFTHLGDNYVYATLTIAQKPHEYDIDISLANGSGGDVDDNKAYVKIGTADNYKSKSEYNQLKHKDEIPKYYYVLDSTKAYEIDEHGELITSKTLEEEDFMKLWYGVYVDKAHFPEAIDPIDFTALDYNENVDYIKSVTEIKEMQEQQRLSYRLVNIDVQEYDNIMYFPLIITLNEDPSQTITVYEYCLLDDSEKEDYTVTNEVSDDSYSSVDFYNMADEQQAYYRTLRDKPENIRQSYNSVENEAECKEDYEMVIRLDILPDNVKEDIKFNVNVVGGTEEYRIRNIEKLCVINTQEYGTEDSGELYVSIDEPEIAISPQEYQKLNYFKLNDGDPYQLGYEYVKIDDAPSGLYKYIMGSEYEDLAAEDKSYYNKIFYNTIMSEDEYNESDNDKLSYLYAYQNIQSEYDNVPCYSTVKNFVVYYVNIGDGTEISEYEYYMLSEEERENYEYMERELDVDSDEQIYETRTEYISKSDYENLEDDEKQKYSPVPYIITNYGKICIVPYDNAFSVNKDGNNVIITNYGDINALYDTWKKENDEYIIKLENKYFYRVVFEHKDVIGITASARLVYEIEDETESTLYGNLYVNTEDSYAPIRIDDIIPPDEAEEDEDEEVERILYLDDDTVNVSCHGGKISVGYTTTPDDVRIFAVAVSPFIKEVIVNDTEIIININRNPFIGERTGKVNVGWGAISNVVASIIVNQEGSV